MKKEFGARLKQLLQDEGIKQNALAEAIGVSPSAVAQWIKGGDIDYANLRKVADFLGVNWVWLRHGEEAANSLQGGAQIYSDDFCGTRRRELEERLANEARMRFALGMADIAIIEWHVLTDRLTYSYTGKDFFAQQINTFGEFASLIFTDDIPLIERAVKEAISSTPEMKYAIDVQIRVKRPDDIARVLRMQGQPVFEYGRAARIVCILLDITNFTSPSKG